MWFTDRFYDHVMFRRSCGNCRFANIRRPSDITLADFWGCEKVRPGCNKDNMGVSLVIINTPVGQKIFNEVKQDLNCFPTDIADAMQPNLMHPSVISRRRDEFENDYVENGFEYVLTKYSSRPTPLHKKISFIVKSWIKYNLRKMGIYKFKFK